MPSKKEYSTKFLEIVLIREPINESIQEKKMKKISLLMMPICFILLILWQVSCTTGKSQNKGSNDFAAPVEESSDNGTIIDKSDKPMLLGDRHKNEGIKCENCHKETPPKNEVPTAVCLECHDDISEAPEAMGAQEINPHYSHMMISECGVCHHAHIPSEDQCKACHDFGFNIP